MIEQYVGIEYKFNGRDRHGVDCYGLVWLVEKELFGKELPILGDLPNKDRVETFAENRALIPGTEVQEPADGDVVLLFVQNMPTHVGVYWDHGVLHASDGRGVVYEKLSSRFMRRFDKKEFYRV